MTILAFLCVGGSFGMGIETAGDMKAITPSKANELVVPGDMNGNGRLDRDDVTIILEIVQGYRKPTQQQLLADPNGDGQLTIDDAKRLLHDLASL